MDKEDVVHIFNGILLSHEKERAHAIYSKTNAARDYHARCVRKRKTNII